MGWKDTIQTEEKSWRDSISDQPEVKSSEPSSDERSFGQVVKDSLTVTNWPKNIAAGLQKVDEYTGAPIRKYVTEAVTGRDLDHAPSGAEQAAMMGFSDQSYGEQLGIPESVRPYVGGNIKPKDVMGMALEAVQDPFLISSAAKSGVSSLAKTAAPAMERASAKAAATAALEQEAQTAAKSAAGSSAIVKGGDQVAEQSGKLFSVKAPSTLDELRDWTPSGGKSDLPAKGRLKEIEKTVPLDTPPLKYHYDMLENPKSMKALKLEFENLPSKEAQQIASYNQQMVNDAGDKVTSTIASISPNKPKGLADAGEDFISSVKGKYTAEKDELAPLFQQLQKSPPLSKQETMDLALAIGENTKLGKLLEVGDDGRVFLNKNTPRSGISDHEYNVLSRVIDDMNDGMTFKEMQDVRDFLRKSVDNTNPSGSAEINKVRSIMLGQMENLAERKGREIGGTFKRYAINERSRENVEKIIGGKIDSIDQMFAANPDRVVKKIFSNPNYAATVGEYIGQDKMNDLIASYVNEGVSKSFDQVRGFDPSSLRRWIKTNDQFLTDYAPQIKDQLSAYADYGYYGKRFLDEVNPSGTAASLMAAMKPEGFMQRIVSQGPIAAVRSEASGAVQSKLKQRGALKTLSESLGEAPKPGGMSRMPQLPPNLGMNAASAQAGLATGRTVLPAPASVASQNEQQTPYVDQRLPMPESNIERAKRINMQRKLQRQSMGSM